MDRDAVPPLDVVPPVEWDTVRKVGGFGLILCGFAALLGVVDSPTFLFTIRLVCVFVGAVAVGLAISFRPELIASWLLGAATAAIAILGTPAHWDSFRLLFGVLTAVALFRAALLAMPKTYQLATISTLILLHFFGILLATASPSPTPWMVDQLYRRVYEPYLQFVYLRNAYHFYSPEPGPASILVCLLKTEDGKEVGADGIERTKYRTEWLVTPKRPADVRDPLGVTYFRRLSLTDQISHGYPDMMNAETFEKSEIRARRLQLSYSGSVPQIPMSPSEADYLEYRMPDQNVARYLLPSYAQHILMDLPEQDRGRTTVKIYRIEHRTLNVGQFIGISNYGRRPGDPYYPTTYYPYFLGEFGFKKDPATGRTRIELLDPQEPMLYWLVPIIERPGGVPGDPSKRDFIDYLSIHAGREFDWSQLR